jgi:hypothetical protein
MRKGGDVFTLFCGLGLVRWSDAPCGKEPGARFWLGISCYL